MKLNEAIKLGKKGRSQDAQVRISPDNRKQWFVMLHDSCNKAYVLADNDDRPIATEDLNELVPLAKSLGLKDFTIFL